MGQRRSTAGEENPKSRGRNAWMGFKTLRRCCVSTTALAQMSQYWAISTGNTFVSLSPSSAFTVKTP